MTNAGWYPDPAGAPHTYRYWDGRAWTQQTSTDPYGAAAPQAPVPPPPGPPVPPPPGPPVPPVAPIQPIQQPAPQQPPAYGALTPTPPTSPPPPPLPPGQQWSPLPGGPMPPSGSGSGRTIAIVAAAVGVVVLLAVAAFVGVRVLGDDSDDSSAGGPTGSTAPSELPSTQPIPSNPTLPGQPMPTAPGKPLGSLTPSVTQCYGGSPTTVSGRSGPTISAGGLTAPSLLSHGYQLDARDGIAFSFLDELQMTSKTVAKNWISPVVVGALPKADGFSGVEATARNVLACISENPSLYRGATALDDVSGHSTKVDGHAAYSLIQNIRIKDAGITVPGDTVQVVVVDTGNPRSYGVFVMAVPIGNQSLTALMKSTAEQLRVR